MHPIRKPSPVKCITNTENHAIKPMGFGLSIVIIIHYYELNMAERRHASHAGIDAVKRASGKKKNDNGFTENAVSALKALHVSGMVGTGKNYSHMIQLACGRTGNTFNWAWFPNRVVCFGREDRSTEAENKRKRTASERDKEEEDDGKLVGPFPVEHDADDIQAAKKIKRELATSGVRTRHS